MRTQESQPARGAGAASGQQHFCTNSHKQHQISCLRESFSLRSFSTSSTGPLSKCKNYSAIPHQPAPFFATHRLSKVSAGGCTLRATATQLPSNHLTILLVSSIIIFTKLKTVGVSQVRTSGACGGWHEAFGTRCVCCFGAACYVKAEIQHVVSPLFLFAARLDAHPQHVP